MGGYFEGYYYKHQKDGNTVCLIAGRADGGEFVQVITNEGARQFTGQHGCTFGQEGIAVDLPGVRGSIHYSGLTPLHSDIMGPFRLLPMQCRHRVVSMYHSLAGGLEIDGQYLDFTGGTGYIEGDMGRSFPSGYLWLHCNDFSQPASVMVAVADIPFCGFHFMGCICAIVHGGREYRLATYRGVRILRADARGLALVQGRYRLQIEVDGRQAHPLKAPQRGQMTATIHESNCSRARLRLWEDKQLVFDLRSKNASFECRL